MVFTAARQKRKYHTAFGFLKTGDSVLKIVPVYSPVFCWARVLLRLSAPARCFFFFFFFFFALPVSPSISLRGEWADELFAGERERVVTKQRHEMGDIQWRMERERERRKKRQTRGEVDEAAAESEMKGEKFGGVSGGLRSFRGRRLLRKWGGWREEIERGKKAPGRGQRWSLKKKKDRKREGERAGRLNENSWREGERERVAEGEKVCQRKRLLFWELSSCPGGAPLCCQVHLPRTRTACHVNDLEGRPCHFITSPRRQHGRGFCLLGSLSAPQLPESD